MTSYYVNNNPQPTGEHEVHKDTCTYLPPNRTYLGAFFNCKDAIVAAKRYYNNVDGCFWCSRDCHTR
ncbi:hypothetical protein CEK66_12735 [Xanthomonas sp. LMG 12460]|uniref:Uncharacterized protein n=1 Tax=Xanthomonas sacchari TaxID=56458 RepID=A0A2P5Z364_9XANT|nr:hypothetical protein CEK66_12735 [Xanthomonas sp. LMG 12460]PPU82131.1 hypothetical protein XsacCFBP4641_12500 [Xanthomonas sacchari]